MFWSFIMRLSGILDFDWSVVTFQGLIFSDNDRLQQQVCITDLKCEMCICNVQMWILFICSHQLFYFIKKALSSERIKYLNLNQYFAFCPDQFGWVYFVIIIVWMYIMSVTNPGHELCSTHPSHGLSHHTVSHRSLKDYISHHPLHQHSCLHWSRTHLQTITQSPSPNHTHTHTT